MTYLVINMLPHFIVGSQSDLLQFGRFILYSFLGIYVAYVFAGWSSTFAERAVDQWTSLSYIKFNRGDEREIEKSTRQNKKHLIKGGIGIAATFVVDVVAKIIADAAVRLL